MPILGTLLGSIFTNLVGVFTQWFSKKVALGAAAVATFATLTGVLWLGIGAALSSMVVMVPVDSAILLGMYVAIPSNAQSVISATIAADTAIALYKWNAENLRLLSYIT